MNEIENREFVLQPNVISRSIYSVSVSARRLMAYAMSCLPPDPAEAEKKKYEVSFAISDYMRSLGLEGGTKTRQLIKAAIEESMSAIIKIESPRGFAVYTWFLKSFLTTAVGRELAWDWDRLTMKFNPELAQAINAFSKQYHEIKLLDLGKLQSRYAIRIFEYCLSYKFFAGEQKNKIGEWFTPPKTIEEYRIFFDVDPKFYKRTGDFRKYVIDNPVEEINRADIGIRIDVEYKRQGKRLIGIYFNCRILERDEPRPTQPGTESGRSDEEFKNAFPKEYEKLYNAALAENKKSPPLPGIKIDYEALADHEAVEKLREAHPVTKKTKKTRGKNSTGNESTP